ncbi:MAG: DNA alkylation repair protein [Candidatus Gastranaerophilales bacterium]|nr:DNA alkylation repair protein [Candidatus Gastranaerophilales bacterium]
MNIRKELEILSEKKYQEFSASLIPNVDNVLGVRTPNLRKLSKEILKDKDCEKFLKTNQFKYMEEYMLKGMVIGLLKKPIEEVLPYIKDFVPTIDNWGVCDCFCCSLKITKNNLEVMWNFIEPYFKSNKEFEIRFAYVMLLNYYLTDEYIDRVLNLIDEFKDERYYSRMAVAWLVSICYINYPNKTERYLKKSKLDIWTFNKSIQKICESLKIDKEAKEKLKQMKK